MRYDDTLKSIVLCSHKGFAETRVTAPDIVALDWLLAAAKTNKTDRACGASIYYEISLYHSDSCAILLSKRLRMNTASRLADNGKDKATTVGIKSKRSKILDIIVLYCTTDRFIRMFRKNSTN